MLDTNLNITKVVQDPVSQKIKKLWIDNQQVEIGGTIWISNVVKGGGNGWSILSIISLKDPTTLQGGDTIYTWLRYINGSSGGGSTQYVAQTLVAGTYQKDSKYYLENNQIELYDSTTVQQVVVTLASFQQFNTIED